MSRPASILFPSTPARHAPPMPTLIMVVAALAVPLVGCGSSMRARKPSLTPLAAAPRPAALDKSHFRGDASGSISEVDLQRVLAAPVFLETGARIGVLPVAAGYGLDAQLPLVEVPQRLSEALEGTGEFDVASEVSADWPTTRSIAGLRELAARYRCEYLMLYRHRFNDASRVNSWGITYLTVLGAFVAPVNTLESAGVLEATMFDAKSGTILFTVFERIRGERTANLWNNDRKHDDMKRGLLQKAATALAGQMVAKVRRLAAMRPAPADVGEVVAARP